MIAETSSSSEESEHEQDIRITSDRQGGGSWIDWFINGCASLRPGLGVAEEDSTRINKGESEIEEYDKMKRIERFRPEIAEAIKVLKLIPSTLDVVRTSEVRNVERTKIKASANLTIVGDIDEESKEAESTSAVKSGSTRIWKALEISPWRTAPKSFSAFQRTEASRMKWQMLISLLNSEVPNSTIDAVVKKVVKVVYPLLTPRDRLVWCLLWGLTALKGYDTEYRSIYESTLKMLEIEGEVADTQSKTGDTSLKGVIGSRHELKSFVGLKSINVKHVEDCFGEWEELLAKDPLPGPYLLTMSRGDITLVVYLNINRRASVFETGVFLPDTSADKTAIKYGLNKAEVSASWATTTRFRDPSVTHFNS